MIQCTNGNLCVYSLRILSLDFSCSDIHAMALDANSRIWTFINWGRPFRLVSPSLDCSSPGTTPVQIECSLRFSAVLTGSGDVYAWWLYEGTLWDQYWKTVGELDKDESAKAVVPDGGTVIPCHTWEMNVQRGLYSGLALRE